MVVYKRITFISTNSNSASYRSFFMCRRIEPLRLFIWSIVERIIFCSCFFSNRYVVVVFKQPVSHALLLRRKLRIQLTDQAFVIIARIVVIRIHTRYARSLMRSRAQSDFITCELFYVAHDILISMRWCTTVRKWRFFYIDCKLVFAITD